MKQQIYIAIVILKKKKILNINKKIIEHTHVYIDTPNLRGKSLKISKNHV